MQIENEAIWGLVFSNDGCVSIYSVCEARANTTPLASLAMAISHAWIDCWTQQQ